MHWRPPLVQNFNIARLGRNKDVAEMESRSELRRTGDSTAASAMPRVPSGTRSLGDPAALFCGGSPPLDVRLSAGSQVFMIQRSKSLRSATVCRRM